MRTRREILSKLDDYFSDEAVSRSAIEDFIVEVINEHEGAFRDIRDELDSVRSLSTLSKVEDARAMASSAYDALY